MHHYPNREVENSKDTFYPNTLLKETVLLLELVCLRQNSLSETE